MNHSTILNTHAIEEHRSRLSISKLTVQHKHNLFYFAIVLVPYLASELLDMEFKGVSQYVISTLNLIAMMAFFIQFPLAGRLKQIRWFANIDWSIGTHKKLGKYLGMYFFLHPLLIVAPKWLVSFDDFTAGIVSMVTSPQLLTAIIAWVAMVIWVLMSIYKDKLNIRYETWRLLHVIGFVIIATLVVLHITSIGSHGQFEQLFNGVWWGLYILSMTIVIYNYLIKPRLISGHPFEITSVHKASECDWELTIQAKSRQSYDFEPGQFVWINTSKSPFNLEQHPFSIASGNQEQGELTFIIRELGDYTSTLNELKLGQNVFVDGPYGSMSLELSSKAKGITLVAGGAGIAPMLGLARELVKRNESRPIHFIYGNQNLKKMVALDELIALDISMPNFHLQLVCQQLDETNNIEYVYQGVVDEERLTAAIDADNAQNWAVYLCGPEGMIQANSLQLKKLGVATNQIHYEHLAF